MQSMGSHALPGCAYRKHAIRSVPCPCKRCEFDPCGRHSPVVFLKSWIMRRQRVDAGQYSENIKSFGVKKLNSSHAAP